MTTKKKKVVENHVTNDSLVMSRNAVETADDARYMRMLLKLRETLDKLFTDPFVYIFKPSSVIGKNDSYEHFVITIKCKSYEKFCSVIDIKFRDGATLSDARLAVTHPAIDSEIHPSGAGNDFEMHTIFTMIKSNIDYQIKTYNSTAIKVDPVGNDWKLVPTSSRITSYPSDYRVMAGADVMIGAGKTEFVPLGFNIDLKPNNENDFTWCVTFRDARIGHDIELVSDSPSFSQDQMFVCLKNTDLHFAHKIHKYDIVASMVITKIPKVHFIIGKI